MTPTDKRQIEARVLRAEDKVVDLADKVARTEARQFALEKEIAKLAMAVSSLQKPLVSIAPIKTFGVPEK